MISVDKKGWKAVCPWLGRNTMRMNRWDKIAQGKR